jgi:DEAD/DEAH box helicase domain-containing protein
MKQQSLFPSIPEKADSRLPKTATGSAPKPPVQKASGILSDATPSGQSSWPLAARYGVLDLETQRSFQEVGGWHRAQAMGISCVVLYDAGEDRFYEYLEHQIDPLVARVRTLDFLVGFNIKRFDYLVLKGYTDFNFLSLATLDILETVYTRLGFRLSLDHLARVSLGVKKSADGLQALKWWKEGRIQEIIDYCRMDVTVTRDLFVFGKTHGYLLFHDRAGATARIPVPW